MDEIPNKGPDPRSSTPDSKWIYRIVMAVVLGEAIWGFLASLTNGLLLPVIARVVGGVPFVFKLSNFFASIIELCLAGIVAVVLNSWSRIIPRADLKSANRASMVTSGPPPATPKPAILPSAVPTSSNMATAATAAAAATALKAPAPVPSPVPPPANPPKPTRQKQTYYNIVGEPVDEDDE